MLKNITAKPGLLHALFMTLFILLLMFTSCTSGHNSLNSQKSRHRSPASTGRNKCGCSMVSPSAKSIVQLTHQSGYALQA